MCDNMSVHLPLPQYLLQIQDLPQNTFYRAFPHIEGLPVILTYSCISSVDILDDSISDTYDLLYSLTSMMTYSGKDITAFASVCKYIPHEFTISCSLSSIEMLQAQDFILSIYGILTIPKTVFDSLYTQFANVTFAIQDVLRTSDITRAQQYDILFIFYTELSMQQVFSDQILLTYFSHNLFAEHIIQNDIQLQEYFRHLFTHQFFLSVFCSGIVLLPLRSREVFDSLCTIYSFSFKSTVSRIERVDWCVGRNGFVVPMAQLTPVMFRNRRISEAKLHCQSVIRKLNVHIHDLVEIEQFTEHVLRVVAVRHHDPEHSQVIETPTHCPLCHSKLLLRKRSYDHIQENVLQYGKHSYLYCLNYLCPAQYLGRIYHFAHCLGIQYLGPRTLHALHITRISQLFDLTVDQLIVGHAPPHSAYRIIQQIHQLAFRPFEDLLVALGVLGIRRAVAKKIMTFCSSFSQLASLDYQTCITNHLGKITTQYLMDFLQFEDHRDFLMLLDKQLFRHRFGYFNLDKNYIDVQHRKVQFANTICMCTGWFSSSNTLEEDYQLISKIITDRGGFFDTRFGNYIQLIICGNDPDYTILRYAKQQHMLVISYAQFQDILSRHVVVSQLIAVYQQHHHMSISHISQKKKRKAGKHLV